MADLRLLCSGVAALLLACGSEAPPTPSPATEPPSPPSVPSSEPTEPPPSDPPEPSSPTAPSPVAPEVRRAFEALLAEVEPPHVDPPSDPTAAPSPAGECALGCVRQNDARLVSVTPLAIEGDGSPMSLEVRVVGRDPLVRTVRVEGGTDEEWARYQDGEGPAPWLGALRAAIPTIEASRPARDLVVGRGPLSFSLSEYAPLVRLGGSFEGRSLFWYTASTAHHLYLVHGAEHQMRWVASLPIEATGCDGSGETSACARPVGIDGVYEVPGAPQLLLRLYHPAPGHDTDEYSTLLVPLDDGSALQPGPEQDRLEIEASLAAPGPRVRPFSWTLRDGEPCDGGCVYFRADRTYCWVFPELLDDGMAEAYSLRRRDGTIATPLLPRASAVESLREDLGDTEGTLARDITARAAIAAWNGFAYSPLVELGPPHMGRRLDLETESDAVVLFWREGEVRGEVARLPLAHAEGSGPWGIDRVLVPEGAGYPLIVVAVAPLSRTRENAALRHRVALLTVTRPPAIEPATDAVAAPH